MVSFGIIILLVVIFLAIVVGGLIWAVREDSKDIKNISLADKEKNKNEYEDLGKGLVEYNQKLQEKKEDAKAKILEMIDNQGKVSNKDVVKALNISSASVKRYLDELEAEKGIKQVGKVGRTVYYSK